MLENWYVYIIECSDKTLYTGITNNVLDRINKHNSGKGAKYTRGRRPVKLQVVWEFESKSTAAQAEYAFKQLSKSQKLALVKRTTGN